MRMISTTTPLLLLLRITINKTILGFMQATTLFCVLLLVTAPSSSPPLHHGTSLSSFSSFITPTSYTNNNVMMTMMTFVEASPSNPLLSPNQRNFLSYIGKNTDNPHTAHETSSCEVDAAAENYYCAQKSGNEDRAVKFTITPWTFSVASPDQFGDVDKCVLAEDLSRLVCIVELQSTIILFAISDLSVVYSFSVTNEPRSVLVRLNNFLYFASGPVSLQTVVYRIKDLDSGTPSVDSTTLTIAVGRFPGGMCLTGSAASNNHKLMLSVITNDRMLEIDVSGPAATPNFANLGDTAFDTSSNDEDSADPYGFACSESKLYAVYAASSLVRYQTFPVLQRLDRIDFLQLGVFSPQDTVLDGPRIFAGGDFLLVTQIGGPWSIHLVDLRTFHVIDSLPRGLPSASGPLGQLSSRAAIAVPSGTNAYSLNSIKFFSGDETRNGHHYQMSVDNLNQITTDASSTVVRHPRMTLNRTEDLGSTSLSIGSCETDSNEEFIFCTAFGFANGFPVKLTLDPPTIAVSGTAPASQAAGCVLAEFYNFYICIFGVRRLAYFRTSDLATMYSSDLSTGQFDNADERGITYARIGGTGYVFLVYHDEAVIRCQISGNNCVDETIGVPESSKNLVGIRRCKFSSDNKIYTHTDDAVGKVYRLNGDAASGTFSSNAGYDGEVSIPHTGGAAEGLDCNADFLFIVSSTERIIVKISLSSFTIVSTLDLEGFTNHLFLSVAISFDSKYLIVGVSNVGDNRNQIAIFSADTGSSIIYLTASPNVQRTPWKRCVSFSTNQKLYCPTELDLFFEFDLIPYVGSVETKTKTKTLFSITNTITMTASNTLQSLTSTRTSSSSPTLRSLTTSKTVSSTATLFSRTKTQSLQSLTTSHTLQSLTETKTRSISPSLQSLTSTKTLSSTKSSSSSQSLQSLTSSVSTSSTRTGTVSSSLQSLTLTRTLSSSSSKSKSATLQSLTSSKSKSKSGTPQSLTFTRSVSASRSLQSLTSTKSISVSPTQQSLTRTISASKSPSLQSLTSTRSLSTSSSLQSLTNTRTVTSTKTTSISATLQSLTATKSSSKSASLQSLTHTKSVSASITLQSLTATRSISSSASLQSLTLTRSSSKSSTLFSLTKTNSRSSSATPFSRSRSQSLVSLTNTQSRTSTKSSTITSSKSNTASLSLQSLTLTFSSSKSVTPISLTKSRSKSSSATLFSRSKSLTLVSLTNTQSRTSTKSSTVTSSKSKTASLSLQSLTVTQTPFSRSSTLSSTKTISNTATFTLPPTPSTTRSLTVTRSKTASLQSLSKTKTSSRSLQSLSKTKSKTSLVIPPPATTTTTTTSSAPGDNVINNLPPSSNIVNALVVSVPSCPSSLNSKCQVRHPQSNECRCPQNTYEQNITLLPSFAFLPSTSATSQLIDQVGNPCVRNEFTLGICTASTSERFISSYTRFGGTTSENGICEQVNPFTNNCSCRAPSTKASFAIATGSPSSFIKKFVTFCLPSNGDLSVFWTIHPDVAASSSTSSNRAEASCVSPNGNVTCECTAGASKTSFGASIFPDSTSTDPVPGDITFCKAKPAEPEEEVNLPVTTTGTVVGIVGGFIEGGGANAVVGIQVAALLMTLCDNNPNVSTSGAKSVVVFFEYPGLPPSAGGLAFMLTLTLGVFFLHALVCFLVGLKRFATSQKIEFDPDKIDYFEEEIETPSFFEQIRFASLQLRFPHWSFFVMNIGFSGVVVESTILLQNTEDDVMVLVGAIGLVLSLIYIALTLYFSYWGIRGVADVRIFDVDESGTSKQLVKMKKREKKMKQVVAELTEVPITDVDDEVFPSAPPKSRATRSSSSRNNKSMSRHRARSSSSRKQSSSTRFRSFKAFSSRSNALSSDASSAASSSSDEEQGHKWLNRRKSIQPSSTPSTSTVLRNSSSRRKSNTTSSSEKPSSRRSSSQQSKTRKTSEVGDDNSVIVYSDAEDDEEGEKSPEQTRRVRQDRKSSTVKMPTDDDDKAEESAGEKNDLNKSSSSSVFSKRNKQMKRAASKRRNPLRPPPRRIRDDEDTSSAEDLDLDESDEETKEEEEENQHEQQKDNDSELTEDDKPPHYVKYGKAMKLFHRFCSFSEYILPNGWWIKHRLYNRRYASMYNSFQPRPTAWAPVTIRIFLFSVSVASSLGGCLIPVTYVGSMALLIALMFLVARPCRRPFDNILLALQLILGSTLAFSRSSNPELSVKLFYGVIGVTFVYVFHIMLLEGLETVSLSSLEMLRFTRDTAEHPSSDDGGGDDDDDDDDDDDASSNDSRDGQKKIAKALSAAHSRHEAKKVKKKHER